MPDETSPAEPKRSDPTPDRIPLHRSLRGRLVLTLVLFVGITAAALNVIDYFYVGAMLRDSVEQQLTLRAQGLVEVLRAHVRNKQDRASLVASRTRLRALLRQFQDGMIEREFFLQESTRILADARDSNESFIDIGIASVDGELLVSTDPEWIGRSVLDETPFVEGLTAPSLGLPERAGDDLVLIIGVPARTNQGRLLGVVLVTANAEPMRDVLDALPSRYASADVRVAALRDGRLRYLFEDAPNAAERGAMRPDPAMEAALAGRAGFLVLEDFEGRSVLAAFQPVGYRDWGLVTQVDAKEAYAPVAEIRTLAIGTGLAVAALGLLVGIRVASRFTEPILDLARVAARVGEGDLEARANLESDDEIGVMSDAFDTMTERLERHQLHLAELVEERTRDLHARTDQLQRSNDQLAEVCRLLEEQAEIMDRDLHRAEQIQRSLLPDEPPHLPNFCVQTLYRPGRNIGGDLYDVIRCGDRHLVLVVADASGHGVSAALLAVLFKHRLRVIDEETGDPFQPEEALSRLNRALCEDTVAPGVFFTCVYCLVDTVDRSLVMASAGHPPLLWFRQDGEVVQVEHTGPALGLYPNAKFEERTLALDPLDRVLLYTDGVFDVGGHDTDPPDVQAIADSLRTITNHRRILEQVLIAVSGGRERPDRDDVTMLLLEARQGESHFHDRREEDLLRVEPEERESGIAVAERDDTRFVWPTGRATWTLGESLLGLARNAFEADRALVIDLEDCDYMDSTILGTLHEVVRLADESVARLTLQHPRPAIREAFAELSMTAVEARVTDEPLEAPSERSAVDVNAADPLARQRRLLAAHEALAELSPRNREAFGQVIEALRSELGDD